MIKGIRIQAGVLLFALVCATKGIKAHALDAGLEPGATVPVFTLKDQDGKAQTLQSLAGPHGLLVLFSRSADWCALCKSQLIDLESARHTFEAKGIHVASVTYDSPEVLKAFAARRDIHFKLLSDPDSHTIEAFGVRNPEATGSQAGIAIPNYFLIGTDGTVVQRFAEGQPQERTTASYLYETVFGAGTAQPLTTSVVPETPHLKVTAAQSDVSVAPGTRLRLTIQLDPGTDEHLYAPGAEAFGYIPIRLTLDSSDVYQTSPAVYGQSTILEFPNLKEKVPVFESSTQITEDVWATPGPKSGERFTQDPELTLHGILEYQVCNTTTCFAPEKKPVSWTLRVVPGNFDRVRVAEALQRK
jgi:peroxiredoxin